MSREQEHAIEELATMYGRLGVRDGFADQHIDVTAPSGRCWNINEDGVARIVQPNFSIHWRR